MTGWLLEMTVPAYNLTDIFKTTTDENSISRFFPVRSSFTHGLQFTAEIA